MCKTKSWDYLFEDRDGFERLGHPLLIGAVVVQMLCWIKPSLFLGTLSLSFHNWGVLVLQLFFRRHYHPQRFGHILVIFFGRACINLVGRGVFTYDYTYLSFVPSFWFCPDELFVVFLGPSHHGVSSQVFSCPSLRSEFADLKSISAKRRHSIISDFLSQVFFF